jgi:hypothetical protein
MLKLFFIFFLFPLSLFAQTKHVYSAYDEPLDPKGFVHDIPDNSIDDLKEFYTICYIQDNKKYYYRSVDGRLVFDKKELGIYLSKAIKINITAYAEPID